MTLSIKQIQKSYGSKEVLKDVSFSISPGQVVGLLGKNGAGKTTLLKIIAGLNSADDGQVMLNNIPVNDPKAFKKRIGYMSERNPLYPDMYVEEYLMWNAEIHNIANAAKRVFQVKDQMALNEVSGQKIKELSKGYKQRVGLAAAVIHEPDLLLLDEPVNGLDPAQILQFRNLIRQLSKNRIILLSSHLMQEIEAVCSRIILLDEGTVKKDELINITNDTQLNQLVIVPSHPINANELLRISSISDVTELSDQTYLIAYSSHRKPHKEIFDYLGSKGLYLYEIRPYKEELDQYFMS